MAFPMTMLKINKCEQYQDVAMKTCKKKGLLHLNNGRELHL